MAVSLLTNNAVSPTINVNAQSASYTCLLYTSDAADE